MSTFFLLGLSLAALFFGRVLQITWQERRSPLRNIPGPWYAPYTGLPVTIAALRLSRPSYDHAMHGKYGPYVRIAPNIVLVGDLEGHKTINRMGSGFVKTDFYHFLGPTDADDPPYGMFNMTDAKDHAKRRRLLGRAFSESAIRADWEDMVREKVTMAVSCIKADAEANNGEVDVRKWLQMMASDVVSQLMFGASFDALKTGKQDAWFESIVIGNMASAFASLAPTFYSVVKRLPVFRSAKFFNAHHDQLEKGRLALERGQNVATNKNLFSRAMPEEGKEAPLSQLEMCVEAALFMLAGTDTTSTTTTYLIWAVLSEPTLRKSLEDEVANLKDPFSDVELLQLPILNAVIAETLRLYSAAPGTMPRSTPPEGCKVGPYFIPGGTEVSFQSWTMHRIPEIFPDPYRFDHTRWYPSGSATTPEATAAFTPWGAGSRVCIGKPIAYMQMRLVVATFFRECNGARLSPHTTPESMEMVGVALVEPKGHGCRILL